MTELILERKTQEDRTPTSRIGESVVMLTPPITPDYWLYRVVVADGQAVLGFPKFGTIGIGFAVEEDWNTNLPFVMDTEAIRKHIWHNRGENLADDDEARELVLTAISLIQEAAHADRATTKEDSHGL